MVTNNFFRFLKKIKYFYVTFTAISQTPTDGTTGDICPAGFYCETGVSTPTSCSPSTYSGSLGNTVPTDCLNCTGGEYCPDYNMTATSGRFCFDFKYKYNDFDLMMKDPYQWLGLMGYAKRSENNLKIQIKQKEKKTFKECTGMKLQMYLSKNW